MENTVEKVEIGCYEQFLLFPLYFQKTSTADTLKPGFVRERVNLKVLTLWGKRENAGYQHFLLFPQCFEKASFRDTSKGVIV